MEKKSEKGPLAKYVPRAVSFFLSMPKESRDSVLKRLNDIVHIRKNVLKYTVVAILALAALVVMLDGAGTLLGWLIPTLVPGASHIIVGLLLMSAVIIYIKLS